MGAYRHKQCKADPALINHHVKGMYLQLYLNEFCYKLNRRYFGRHLFERLSLAMAHSYRHTNG
jgi:hypothetical protein